MSSEVEAAIIAAGVAAGVGILTFIGAVYGTRKASQDTKDAVKQQLADQRDQLAKTLAEQRTRTLNERFATAAGQLGSDKPPEVRLAGVYAMAGLADDWPENRQTCVDVLCGYLRLPYNPDSGDSLDPDAQSVYRRNREVRHTVIRVITAHLKLDAADPKSWQGLNFDFTDVVFDGGDFSGGRFSSGRVDFIGAQFSGGTVSFYGARFSGGTVYFNSAQFSGGTVDFRSAGFFGGTVSFYDAGFSGGTVSFHGAGFSGGRVDFHGAGFSGGTVDFRGAGFSGGRVSFYDAEFSGSTVDFSDAGDWSFPPAFPWTDTPPPGVKLPKTKGQSRV